MGDFNVTGQLSAYNLVDNLTKVFVTGPAGTPPTVPAQRSTFLSYGPGWSLGNDGGWSSGQNEIIDSTFYTRGITQQLLLNINKRAVGDTAGIYAYVTTDGGTTAESDEGTTGMTIEVSEQVGHMHGVIRSTTGTGDESPTLTCTSGPQWTTDGGVLLNISKGTISGNLNGFPIAFHNALYQYPVTNVTLPLTSAYGTIDSDTINPFTSMDQETPVDIELTLGTIGGVVQPFVPGVCAIAGLNYPQQAIISSVGSVTGGKQTITVGIRYLHRAGSMIFQGGIAGQAISLDAQMALVNGNGTHTNRRTTYPAFGSIDGTHMIYASYVDGGFGSLTFDIEQYSAARVTGAQSGFHLYPYAEVVANTTPGAVNVSGDMIISTLLEPNGVVWAVDDIVECPHYYAAAGTTLYITEFKDSPTTYQLGSSLTKFLASGQGVSGSRYVFWDVENNNPMEYYWSPPASGVTPTQGPLTLPTFANIVGCFNGYFYIDQAPPTGGTVIGIANLAGNDPANVGIYDFFRAPGAFGAVRIQVDQANTQLIMPQFTVGTPIVNQRIVMSGGSYIDFTGTTGGGVKASAYVETDQLLLKHVWSNTPTPNYVISCRVMVDGSSSYVDAQIPVYVP